MEGEFKKPGDFSGFTLEHSLETPPLLHPGGSFSFMILDQAGFLRISNTVMTQINALNLQLRKFAKHER